MKIYKKQTRELILGTTFLGTGGGGNPEEAKGILLKIFRKKNFLTVSSINSFKPNDIFISPFGIGSSAINGDPGLAVQTAFWYLSKYLKKKVNGIIPVEIGPKSVATAFYLSSLLNLPVIDADIVGGRSSPEVFLETITLFGIKRTPAAVVNNQGDVAILLNSSSAKREENFFRDFAIRSGGKAYVVGYPLTKRQVSKSIECGTLSKAFNIGRLIRTKQTKQLFSLYNVKKIIQGRIINIKSLVNPGFAEKLVTIKDKGNQAEVYIKNENLICWVNGKIFVSCPDLIVLLDKNQNPLYNTDLKLGAKVEVVSMPALPLWQSKKARRLFNPEMFGFNIKK